MKIESEQADCMKVLIKAIIRKGSVSYGSPEKDFPPLEEEIEVDSEEDLKEAEQTLLEDYIEHFSYMQRRTTEGDFKEITLWNSATQDRMRSKIQFEYKIEGQTTSKDAIISEFVEVPTYRKIKVSGYGKIRSYERTAGKRWVDNEISYLKEARMKDASFVEIAEHLGRTKSSVSTKWHRVRK